MHPLPVIAIFDIGKTNKKLFLFDSGYHVVQELTTQFEEINDEDGFPCEDLNKIQTFILDSLTKVICEKKFDIKAVNFAGYGASFVHLDAKGNALTPLYNYLKPYPEVLKLQFYDSYGGEEKISLETASPVSGSLNSGMQLYRIRKEQPEIFEKIRYSLHLPQYLSSLITNKCVSDITSIGCHTQLWKFQRKNYHDWVVKENIENKLAPLVNSITHFPATIAGHQIASGIGLHDSSAALIPYLIQLKEPFLLISTGTWSISLNPFNHSPLTANELKNDCLCYLSFKGEPVKASRLFSGYEHEKQSERIAVHFNQQPDRYKSVHFKKEIIPDSVQTHEAFQNKDLNEFHSYEEAYHHLIFHLVRQQLISSRLILNDTNVSRIFVDGGFSKNEVYMNLLASVFPEKEVFAANMSQATALGAAMAIHTAWNNNQYPSDLIELKQYPASMH